MKLQPPIQPRPPPHSDVVGVLVVSADKMRVAQDILVPHYLILYRVVVVVVMSFPSSAWGGGFN